MEEKDIEVMAKDILKEMLSKKYVTRNLCYGDVLNIRESTFINIIKRAIRTELGLSPTKK